MALQRKKIEEVQSEQGDGLVVEAVDALDGSIDGFVVRLPTEPASETAAGEPGDDEAPTAGDDAGHDAPANDLGAADGTDEATPST